MGTCTALVAMRLQRLLRSLLEGDDDEPERGLSSSAAPCDTTSVTLPSLLAQGTDDREGHCLPALWEHIVDTLS